MNTNPQENDEYSDEETADGGSEVVQPVEEEPIEGGDITGLDEPLGAFNREKHEGGKPWHLRTKVMGTRTAFVEQ